MGIKKDLFKMKRAFYFGKMPSYSLILREFGISILCNKFAFVNNIDIH